MVISALPPPDCRGQDHRSSIMNVGKRVDYAVRALCYLAAQPEHRLVSRNEIQARQNIPPHFLSKILRSMVNGGLLVSVAGARGGFRLGKPASDMNMRDVYESVEGPLALVDCVEGEDDACRFATICTQIEIWRGAQNLLAKYLEGISIRDIADRDGLVHRLESKAPAVGA